VRIVVPVKQVPATDAVTMDPETGTMVRSAAASVINPLDLYALEAALRLRDSSGDGDVVALTMGPPPAEAVLREAVSLGCDRGILLSDTRFGGADTWATSRVLAAAIERLKPIDLVITGERATDGDTAQVGPGIAAWLDIPLATYVAHVTGVDGAAATVTVERLVEDGYQIVRLSTPALLTVVKEIAPLRLPTLDGVMRARRAEFERWGAVDLAVPAEELGLKGSPTRVVNIATPQVTREGETIDAGDEAGVAQAAVRIADLLEDAGVVR